MKLVRFELLDNPGEVRSGLVYSGKIYETDGQNPIAVHEAEAVRPLPPIGLAPCIRFFDFSSVPEPLLNERASLHYVFGNPSAVIGPSQIVPYPAWTAFLDVEPFLIAVVGTDGHNVPVEEADGYVLGLTLGLVLVARDAEREEREARLAPGRSRDIAIAVGPVLSTPDDLDESVVGEERGRRYKLASVLRINDIEAQRGDAEDLAYTVAEAISAASDAAPIRAGELIAIGPIARPIQGADSSLQPGDEVKLAVERLGALSLKIAL